MINMVYQIILGISIYVRVLYDIVNFRRMYILSMNGKLNESALKILAVDKK